MKPRQKRMQHDRNLDCRDESKKGAAKELTCVNNTSVKSIGCLSRDETLLKTSRPAGAMIL